MSQKLDHALGLYMHGIRDGNVRDAITKYTGDRYTQHSTGVPDGVEGFIAFFVERWTNAEVVPADTGNSGKF